nr:MAG TPA_asm: hypothetical protein [Caudoviricetes sp.]
MSNKDDEKQVSNVDILQCMYCIVMIVIEVIRFLMPIPA